MERKGKERKEGRIKRKTQKDGGGGIKNDIRDLMQSSRTRTDETNGETRRDEIR